MTDRPPHGSVHEPADDARLLSEKLQELKRLIRSSRLDGEPQSGSPSSHQPSRHSNKPSGPASAGQEAAARKLRAHAKLSALARLLGPLYNELPELGSAAGRAASFAFSLVPGTPPRYWIDLKSFILMAPDGETYRFVRAMPQMGDTLEGPRDLVESKSMHEMADWVADYVVEVLTSPSGPADPDLVGLSQKMTATTARKRRDFRSPSEGPETSGPAQAADPEKLAPDLKAQTEPQPSMGAPSRPDLPPIIIKPAAPVTDWVKLILALALGIVLGGAGLFTVAWLQTPPAL